MLRNPIQFETAAQIRATIEANGEVESWRLQQLASYLGGDSNVMANASRDGQLLYLLVLLMTAP